MTQEISKLMADLDALHKRGLQLLQRLQQDIEYFRRPPLIKSTGAMTDLVAMANSPGLIAYQEGGCRKADKDCSLVGRLNTTLSELQEHIQKNKALLKQMQCTQEERERLTLDELASCHLAEVDEDADCFSQENRLQADVAASSGEIRSCAHRQGSADLDRTTMGRAVLAMYEKDVKMKALIVSDLNLSTPSHLLQAYSIMWGFRPYISDEAIEEFKNRSNSAG